MCALFSLEILPAGAVKGLTYSEHNEQQQTVPIQSSLPRQYLKHFVVILSDQVCCFNRQ